MQIQNSLSILHSAFDKKLAFWESNNNNDDNIGIYIVPLTQIKALNNNKKTRTKQRKKDKQNNKGLITRLTEKVGLEVFFNFRDFTSLQ